MVKKEKNKGAKLTSTKSKSRRTKKPRVSNASDGIDKSQRLLQSTRKTRSTRNNTRRIRSLERRNALGIVCGKPMPPLSELERMYEDSDEEIPEVNSRTKSGNMFPQPIIPMRKYKKPEVPYIVGCTERPRIPEKPNCNVFKGDNYGITSKTNALPEDEDEDDCKTPGFNINVYSLSKSKFNAQANEIAAELLSYESIPLTAFSDSDDTVVYELNSPINRFSPVPSTSRDSETISKNEQKFIESISVSKNSNKTLNKIEPINQTKVSENGQIHIGEEIKNCSEGSSHENNVTSYFIDYDDIQIIDDDYMSDSGLINEPELCIKSANNVSNNLDTKGIFENFKESNVDDVMNIDKLNGNLEFCNDLTKELKPLIKGEKYNCKPFDLNVIIDLDNIDEICLGNQSIINKYSKHNNLGTTNTVDSIAVRRSVPKENTHSLENVTNIKSEHQNNNSTNNFNKSSKIDKFEIIVSEFFDMQKNCDHSPPARHTTHLSSHGNSNSNKKNKRKKNDLTHNNIEIHGQPFVNNGEISSLGPKQTFLGTCPICLEDLCKGKLGSTTCGHLFCMPCITRALKTKPKICPTCRKKLTGIGYHQIFL